MPGAYPKAPGTARRRNAGPTVVMLPAEGRKGSAPRWPLPPARWHDDAGEILKLELQLWRAVWKTPQAVAWDQVGYTREVAQYVRWKVKAELGDVKASMEARQLADRLGLTPVAMLRLRWVIVTDQLAAEREARAPQQRPRPRAVDPTLVPARTRKEPS